MTRGAVGTGWTKVGFVEIAAKAAINEVSLDLITAARHWNEMVDRELTPRIFFANTAVAATAVVALSHFMVSGMCRHC
jgi:hypothetical protein